MEWITARDLSEKTRTEWISQGEGDIAIQVPLGPELQRDFDNLWPRYLPAMGFAGPVTEFVVVGTDIEGGSISGERMTSAARDFIDRLEARGYDMVAYAPNWQKRHRTFGIRTPTGEVVGQTTIDTGNDVAAFFRGFVVPVFSIAGGFAFLGQQAAAVTGLQPQTAASIIRTAVNVAAGGDIERSLIGTIAPAVIAEYAPTTILSPPELGAIEPELLQVESVAVELAQELPAGLPWSDVMPDAVAELLTPPQLLPEVEPLADDGGWMVDFEVTEAPPPPPPPPPVETKTGRGGFFRRGWKFEPEPEPEPVYVAPPEPVAELPPELLPPPEPIFEPIFEPVYVAPPPLELLPEPMPPTIEPPGVLIMDDFFTADDYAFPGGFGFDFDTLEPIPTIDAGGALDLDLMPMFPTIDIEDTTFTGPITGGEVADLVTVGDINVITTDLSANYVGTGGTVETSTPAGATVVEVLKDATAAMVAALGLVQAYRSLTSKPAPNPVAQARQGANTVRANSDGTITTTGPDGRTRTARPPVGQPQMTIDGSMIVNNGDGTFTRISRDGASVVNRYPLDITERFGAAASSPYALPLLIGGAALVLFAARRR